MRPSDFYGICPAEFEEALLFYGKSLTSDRFRRYIDAMEVMRLQTYYIMQNRLKGEPTMKAFMPFKWESDEMSKELPQSFTDEDARYYEQRLSGKIKKRRK